MGVIDERMAKFSGYKPQTYGDWSDPTSGSVSRWYSHLLHHVLQKALNMRQCESGIRDEIIVMEYFFDFFRKSQTHHNAQCLLVLGVRTLFLGRDLFPMLGRFAVGAALLGTALLGNVGLAKFACTCRISKWVPVPTNLSGPSGGSPLPRRKGCCVEDLESREGRVWGERFSSLRRALRRVPVSTSFSLEMGCSECTGIQDCHSLSSVALGLRSCIHLWTSSRLFNGPSWAWCEFKGGT